MAGAKVSIADLRPTQLTLGLAEVAERAAKIAAMKPSEREAYLARKAIPYVLGPSRRRREIIQGMGEAQQPLRAMRTKARDGFIKALRDAHRWLDELLFDPAQTIESLAIREGKSERSIRMTLSLAFISPVLAEAAMEGRLPRGFCVKRLTDLPMLWSEQWRAVGLQQPI